MENTSSVQKIIGKKFESFPDDLKSVVATTPLANIIFQVGRDHGLAIDKIGYLGEVVGDFLAGDIEARDIVPTMQDRLSLSEESSREVARGINRLVFRPIREKLRGLPKESSSEIPIPPPALPPVPPSPPPKIDLPPQGPKPQPPQTSNPDAPRGPAPLIIHPLPSSRFSRENKEFEPLREIATGQPASGKPSQPAEKPAPAPPTAPATGSAPSTRETSLPAPAPIRPSVPQPTAPELSAPTISPLGARPSLPPSKLEASRRTLSPPPPTSGYERAREQVKKELALLQPAPSSAPARLTETQPPPTTTKELLQQEIEKFRSQQSPPPSSLPKSPPTDPPAPALPPQRPTPPPLKLPQQKVPTPQAPEKYAVDPYKEPPE